jgi:dCTP diphosphatase
VDRSSIKAQRMTDSKTTVRQLRDLVADFVAERAWEKFHDPKNLSMSIAIEAAELMEHFQWARSDEVDGVLRDQKTRDEIREEIADIACFLLALANALDLDLAAAVQSKMARNREKYPADQFRGRYYKPSRGDEPPPAGS